MTKDGLISAITAASQDVELASDLAGLLDSGVLDLASTAGALQNRLKAPMSRVERLKRVLTEARECRCEDVSLALRVAVATRSAAQVDACQVEVATTHPRLLPRARTTGGVARELVRSAHEQLLIVGYRATTDTKMTGLASQTLKAIADAARRGVSVTAVMQRDVSNRKALLRAFPEAASRAALYTWPEQEGDEKASLHAKVLVADRGDALVTSANLTYHGFSGNVELGVRIKGPPAAKVAEVFEELIRAGEFVKWTDP